ncbi:MAG: glycosyl hydrolase [Pyrinomonadaceae bacterium]|nr:glycosyl hydrolase [Pyrinomonadaceae bacterium]
MWSKVLLVCLLLGLGLFFSLPSAPRPDAREMLRTSWNTYKAKFIQADGRVIDWRGGQITTSEGQSYAMLRAVWIDDRETFDRTRLWANNNLRVNGTALYAWKWGRRDDGSWGTLNLGAASDADQDIAYALLLAARRWRAPEYEAEARTLLNDLWKLTVVESPIGPILTAGDWAAKQPQPAINPSYLAPYAYRLFATVDRDHPWLKMVDASYEILNRSAALSPVGLVPDWCQLERATGRVLPAPASDFPEGTGHSYDAWRAAWRIAFDAQIAPKSDSRAAKFLQSHRFVLDYWRRHQHLPEGFRADGSQRTDIANIAAFGCSLPAFAAVDPTVAKQLYTQEMLGGYERLNRSGAWGDPLDYYGQNWMWLGIALYADSGAITKLVPSS